MTPKQKKQQELALTLAHHNYSKGLTKYAFLKLNNRALSEDLVQVTFMKTWNYLVKGKKIDLMKSFLYHILNDLIIDEYRKYKTTSLDVLLEKNLEPNTDYSGNFIDILLNEKAAFLLIKSLPEKYQKVINMRYMQNLSLKEISLITGQSKNTIAVQIHRGLEKLKLLQSPAYFFKRRKFLQNKKVIDKLQGLGASQNC